MILMSNNQWKCDENAPAWAAIGEDCSAEARVPLLVRAYRETAPDILGLQEVSVRQAELMMSQMRRAALPDGTEAVYEYVSGGDTPIVYRSDRLTLLESAFFRYAKEVPGCEGSFNNGGTKSYCWGVFEEKASGRRIALMTTHLWWKSGDPAASSYQPHSDDARRYQLMLAASKMNEVIAAYRCPGILMGDLNAVIDSPCLRAAEADGWIDVHGLSRGFTDETRGHHFCYASGFRRDVGGTFSQAIDHILAKNLGGAAVESFHRVNPEYFDRASDHYPLYIELSL